MELEFREIYCNNCKKILGRYNRKYYSDAQIRILINANHDSHIKEGHDVEINSTGQDIEDN